MNDGIRGVRPCLSAVAAFAAAVANADTVKAARAEIASNVVQPFRETFQNFFAKIAVIGLTQAADCETMQPAEYDCLLGGVAQTPSGNIERRY